MSSLVELAIIPLFVQAILYGLYLASLFHCLRWLIFDDTGWNARQHINYSMLSITMIVFFFSTIGLILEMRMAIGPALEIDVIEYEKQNLYVRAISNIVRLIFDATLIYHCWVVHAKSWRVNYMPLILWLSCLASYIALLYYNSIFAYTIDQQPSFNQSNQIFKILILFYSCNIATAIYTTATIMYQLLRTTNCDEPSTSARLCHILVESGALYTLTSALLLASKAVDAGFGFETDIFQALLGTINFSVACISFNLILIRVSQSHSDPERSRSGPQSTQDIFSTLQFHVSYHTYDEHADEEQAIASKKDDVDSDPQRFSDVTEQST